MNVLNDIYPEGILVPDDFHGRNIVQMPTVKTHIYTTTTGAMKNAFGGLLSTKRHYTHSWIHRTLVDLLAIQKEIHSGLFAVMDGTTAGNGPGPRTMFPVIKDYMLASQDQVAIDAVAAKMMGFDPMSLEHISVAHEDGLGVGDPRDISLVGDDGDDLFVGVAPSAEVATYLAGVQHAVGTGLEDGDPVYRSADGVAPQTPPTEQDFWVASADGTDPQLTWPLEDGSWTVVIMNSDGSAAVSAEMRSSSASTPAARSLMSLAGSVRPEFRSCGGALGRELVG